jgi:histidinol-phosphate aminotransferase
MLVKTIKSFNQITRHALLEKVEGYVSKNKSLEEEIVRLKKKLNLQKIYRFDLGENVDGFSPLINDFLENLYKNEILFSKLHEYPDIAHLSLRKRLGAIFNIPRQNIVISAGLDSILDLVTRVFFEYKDIFLMPVPGFFLFESYSERMGATPIFLQLSEEDDFTWTEQTIEKFKDLISKFRPKIIWISNPNNPTGQIISENLLLEIIELAYSYNVYVVVDEAYQEFIGGPKDSAAKYTGKFNNLLVMKTFSKALGLAGIRLGYLICSNSEIIEALLLHRHHFPITQLSLNIARIATKDTSFITRTQKNTEKRRAILFKNLDTLQTFKYIPSKTNIFMLKNKLLSATELDKKLKQFGIITSYLNITGILQNIYLRITIRNEEDNLYLFNACKKINDGLQALS